MNDVFRPRAHYLALGALAIATPALAEERDLDGASCATSLDCGTLKCIDERCRDVAGVGHGKAPPPWEVTVGHSAMFGDGHGYGKAIAITDILATVTEPFLMLATVASAAPTSSIMGVVCFVPVGFAGSLVHVANGRSLPAVISFFAWTSLAGTTFVVGGLFGLAFQSGSELNSVAAWSRGSRSVGWVRPRSRRSTCSSRARCQRTRSVRRASTSSRASSPRVVG